MQKNFSFNTSQINRLFPFHFIINKNLEIVSLGISLQKLIQLNQPATFTAVFSIPRPLTLISNTDDLKALVNQLVVLQLLANEEIKLRGQFEINDDATELEIIFLGSPWFSEIEQVKQNNLLIGDFAHHDPLIDLLHITKAHQLNSEDLSGLVTTINKQKNDLKKANQKNEEIALFPTQNPDPLIRINFEGEVISNNPAAALLDFIEYKNNLYRNDEFFEIVAKEIDFSKKRWTIEAKANDIDYSFVCITMLDHKYINIYGRDITQQKKDQEELEILSLIIQKTNNAVIITDAEGKLEWANTSFETITEYKLEEVIGKKPGQFLQGKDTDMSVVEKMRQSIANFSPFTCELLNYTKSGKSYWLRINAQPIYNEHGKVIKFFALEEDITTEKETQNKLELQRIFYEQILDNIPNDIAVFDKNHTYLYLNPAAVKDTEIRKWLIGKKDEDYAKKRNKDIQFLDQRKAIFDKVVTTRQLHNWEEKMEAADGSTKTIVRNLFPVFGNDNHLDIVIGYGIDITEIKKIQQQIIISEKRFKDVIENSLAIITTHDLNGVFITTNPMVSKIFGYETDEMVGKKISSFLPVADKDNFEKVYLSNIIENKKATGIFRVVKKDGELIYILYNNFLKEEKGKEPYVIGFAVDITERVKAENELKLAKKTMEQLALSKQNFLANMSHEIRTPMNAIIGMSNQLNKTTLLPKQQFYLNTIQTAADNLLVIINDILDISKMEAGKLSIEKIGFEPKSVFRRALQVMLHKAEEKGIALTNSVYDKKIAEILIGDPYRINQILLNLISNAIKFTEHGSVDLQCTIKDNSASMQTLSIKIIDTGIGMDKDFSKKIFEKFQQEDESTTRKFGGTGLGMSICKDLVELMQGTIAVDSTKGKGTTVLFELPMQIGSITDINKEEKLEINNTALKGLKILVVDDNEMNRILATTILNNFDIKNSEATNGLKAIELIESEDFDLVLMDVQMPIMDGLEATKKIRSKPEFKNLPIIALTALAVKGDEELIIAAGMNDYISKPFKEERLIEVISKWANTKLIMPKKEKLITQESNTNLYSLKSLEDIAKGNQAFINKMLTLFVDQATITITEIKAAYSNEDFTKVAKLAHRIKPSIGNLEIISLKDVVREIELNATEYGKSEKLQVLLDQFENVLNKVSEQIKKII
jgi:PAS domain S-box-containing protein